MIAILYGLQSFVDKLFGKHVRVQCDNTTAVSVINNMGTTRSPLLSAIQLHKIYGSYVRKIIYG